jgi:histidinol-phosphate/aromatic aminotransferase/cobyric acid decarboxylase-like protein
MRPEPRPELLHMPDPVHGALDFAELDRLALAPEAVLDFSVNGNPYGPSPGVREALAQVPYDRYPDRETLALRRVLSAHLDVPAEHILVGNGTCTSTPPGVPRVFAWCRRRSHSSFSNTSRA